MFTFGAIALILGTLAFLISLFCLIIGKAMGVSLKGPVIMTLGCILIIGVGVVCVGPISVTPGSGTTNSSDRPQTGQPDYGSEPISGAEFLENTSSDTSYDTTDSE